MAKKILGHVELEWTCKRCETKNPGTVKTCTNCGAPMEAGESFSLPVQQMLITDEEKLAQAGKGPDIICPYCTTRNPAGTATCIQCGGNLKGAQAREQGQVLGAYQAGPAPDIKCPACGTANPANAPRCSNCGASLAIEEPVTPLPITQPDKGKRPWLWIGLAVALGIVACIGLAALLVKGARTTATPAIVQGVQWERSIQVIALLPADHQDWQDQVPAGADLGTCSKKLRETRNEPAPGSVEVCGTPYTIDEGSGLGQVVQDCQYEVYAQWCSYTADEWQVTDTAILRGSDLNPAWPALSLAAGQEAGDRAESYAVTFQAEGSGQTYLYRLDDPTQFAQYTPGSRWNLQVNGFGSVVGVEGR